MVRLAALVFIALSGAAAAQQQPLPMPRAYVSREIGEKAVAIMDLLKMLHERDAEIAKLKADLEKTKKEPQ